jgi:hypothetical protein
VRCAPVRQAAQSARAGEEQEQVVALKELQRRQARVWRVQKMLQPRQV